MKLDISGDGSISWRKDLTDEDFIAFIASDIRRERTGLHADLGVFWKNTVLAHTTCNIGRIDERGKLIRKGHAKLNKILQDAYPAAQMEHDLDVFTMAVKAQYASEFRVMARNGAHEDLPVSFYLRPYVMEGGGTLLFAPPGSGKSSIALLMAVAIDSGSQELWDTLPATALYINLERSARSLERRLRYTNIVLGLEPTRPLLFLHARGQRLSRVADEAHRAVLEHNIKVVFFDSISRGGFGSLKDDEPANAAIDALNYICETWLALAHTPREDSTHVYGSHMFEAGEDIGVRMVSAEGDTGLGIGLQVVKANDMKKPPMRMYALEFDEESRLIAARKADFKEYPELLLERKMTRLQHLIEYVAREGAVSGKQAAEALAIPAPDVSSYFVHSGKFQFVRKEGKENYYGLKTENVPPAEGPPF